jgi:hypothetical protein
MTLYGLSVLGRNSMNPISTICVSTSSAPTDDGLT